MADTIGGWVDKKKEWWEQPAFKQQQKRKNQGLIDAKHAQEKTRLELKKEQERKARAAKQRTLDTQDTAWGWGQRSIW